MLGGIGNWLRQHIDAIGAQINPFDNGATYSSTLNKPQQQPKVQYKNTVQVNNQPNQQQIQIARTPPPPQSTQPNLQTSKPNLQPAQSTNQTSIQPPNLYHNPLQGNPLMQNKLSSVKFSSPQKINVPPPQPGGIHSFNTPPQQQSFIQRNIANPVQQHVVKPIWSADKYIANNLGLTDAAKASGLIPGTTQSQRFQSAKNLVEGAVKFPIHAGETIGNTLQQGLGYGEAPSGTTPALQTQYRQIRKTNGTLPAVLETGLSGITDVAALAGGVKPAVERTNEIGRNEIGAVGKNVNPESKPNVPEVPRTREQIVNDIQANINAAKEATGHGPGEYRSIKGSKTGAKSNMPAVMKPFWQRHEELRQELNASKVTPPTQGVKVETPQIDRTQLTGKQLSTPNAQLQGEGDLNNLDTYARTFGITKLQAEKDFSDMANNSSKIKQLSPEELRQMGPQEKLTIRERRQFIRDNPSQTTKNQVNLNVPEGNIRGAIAQATGLDNERSARFAKANQLGSKLDAHDQGLIYRYDNGENIDDLAKNAHYPSQFTKAARAAEDALDYSLAVDRAGGGSTLKQQNYIPHYYQADEAWMDQNKIPEDQRIKINGQYAGFRDDQAKYSSYIKAGQKGLKPLFNSPFEAIQHYGETGSYPIRSNLLMNALAHAAPGEVGTLNTVRSEGGERMTQAAGHLPFSVTDRVNNQLKGLGQEWQPKSTPGKIAYGGAKVLGRGTKAILWLGSWFHYANLTKNIEGLDAITGHPIEGGKDIGTALQAAVRTKAGYEKMLDGFRNDDTKTLEGARKMGIVLRGGSKLNRFEDGYVLSLTRAALKHGIDPVSEVGTDLGKVYNAAVGRKNAEVENLNPTFERLRGLVVLAPHYLTTQLELIKMAALPKKAGGIGYDDFISKYSPGGAARGTVLGGRLLEAALAITTAAIITHKFPNVGQIVNEAGLNSQNPVPNVDTGEKNKKGEHTVTDLPTDPLGLLVGFITNPGHFTQSRFSPGGSFIQKVVTNKNWNDQPLSDPNQPNAWETRVKNAALNSFLPIGVQNLTNFQNSPTNPSFLQGIAQQFGGRVKVDPNDPQVQAQKQYFNQQNQYTNDIKSGNFGAINPALAGMDKKYAAEWAAKWKSYQDLSPGKDINGVENSSAWNALSSQQKASYFLMNDPKTGAQELSPIFYIAQRNARMDPSRPHSPLYDLQGNDGLGFTLDNNGNVVGVQNLPRPQVAMNYQNAPSDQKALILAANPWLADYEKAVGYYSQNYVPLMTAFMQKEGWDPTTINQYWADHPSLPSPIQSAVTDAQQKLMGKYESISDPQAKSTFFDDNAAELSKAFTAAAIYSRQDAVAKGMLPNQLYPNPTPQVAALLAQLQKNPNHDKAISKANAILIQNNPTLNQYLADTGIYDLAKDAGRYQYEDPAHPGLSASQLLNLNRPIDQSTMKSISDVAKYDIGYNPATGQYGFMQNGNFTSGANAGKGLKSGYSKSSGHRHYQFHQKKIPKLRVVHTRNVKNVKLTKPKTYYKIQKDNKHPVRIKQAKTMV